MNGAHLLVLELFAVLVLLLPRLARWACYVPGCNTGGDQTGDQARDMAASHYRREHHEPEPAQCTPCMNGSHYTRCARHNAPDHPCACSCRPVAVAR